MGNNNEEPKKETIGLALSGGIFVAAAAGAATMRGFQQQSIAVDGTEKPAMEAFDYISGLSGGIIPTMLYCYAQNVDSSTFLDADFRIADPSEITPAVLNRRSGDFDVRQTDPITITPEMANSRRGQSIFELLTASLTFQLVPMALYGVSKLQLDKIWSMAMWHSMVAPFGIGMNQSIASETKAAVSTRDGVKAIPLCNFVTAGEAKDIGNATIDAYNEVIRYLTEEKKLNNKFVPPGIVEEAVNKVGHHLLMPYTAGPVDVRNNVVVGSADGKTLDAKYNCIPSGEWGDTPMSLEFLMGAGTNMPGMTGVLADDRANAKVFAMTHASQKRIVKIGDGDGEKNMLFVDGGMIDGLGVPALVHRKVRKIVASVCGHGPDRKYEELYKDTKGKSLEVWLSHTVNLGIYDIASYFGFYRGDDKFCAGSFMNRMFEGGEEHLSQLRETFDALFLAGKPLVATMKDLKTVGNPFWGIAAGETVDLTIIYYTAAKSFVEKIPQETAAHKEGAFTDDEFEDFPHFNGMSNFDYKDEDGEADKAANLYNAIVLTKRQTNMTAYLGSWIINEAWDGLTVDGKKVFEGFKEILQN